MQPRNPSPGQHRNTPRVFLLADDLTGACDSAAAFLASGSSVRIILDSATAAEYSEDVIAVTTESRSLTPQAASENVTASVLKYHVPSTSSIIFKKIDSAARGNVGAETLAALEASTATLALVAPAFPRAGRTVDAGILTICDTAGQNSTVSLRTLFATLADDAIQSLPCGSESELQMHITAAANRGTRVLLCDAQSQADLESLAAAALRVPHSILWAGSAGLSYALAAKLPVASALRPVETPTREGRTILFAGTDHPVTTRQIAQLAAHPTAPEKTVHSIDWTGASHASIRTAFAAAPTAALILTGGDTAAFVLQALDASSIVLAGEIAPGIPWGYIAGGVANDTVVVTKSGGFGTDDTLVHAFKFCSEICKRSVCVPA